MGKIFTDLKDVEELFEELTPWDKAKFLAKVANTEAMSQEEIIDLYDINPLEFVDVGQVEDKFKGEIVGQMDEDELVDELASRGGPSPRLLIDMVADKSSDFFEGDILRLEKIVNEMKAREGIENN